jgi:hypothetical protein
MGVDIAAEWREERGENVVVFILSQLWWNDGGAMA